jgi:adenylate cyclase
MADPARQSYHAQTDRRSSKPRSSQVNGLKPCLLSGLITSGLAIGVWQLGLWQPLERIGYNTLFQVRNALMSEPEWDPRIAIVAIDDDTLAQKNQFPLSRRYYTKLLHQLESGLPAAIGFDILFSESTPEDAEFAEAIANHWTVVLPVAATRQGEPIYPMPQLSRAAAAEGHVVAALEPDGISRQMQLYQGTQPAFALALLQVYHDSMQVTAGDTNDFNYDPVHLESILNAPNRPVWINWPGPTGPEPIELHQSQSEAVSSHPCVDEFSPGALHVYPLHCVLDGAIAPKKFTNKIVLVGVTATGVDPLQTPFDQAPPTSSVYLHAALVDNLLNDRLLHPSPQWATPLILMGVSFGVISLLLPQGPKLRVAIASSLPVFWFGFVLLAFNSSWWLPVAAPIGTIILAAVGLQLIEQSEKQQLMDLFAMHVAPELAKVIWQRKSEIFKQGKLHAQEVMATVLFVDIRGFTSISEHLPSQLLIDWLNRYFNAMTDCIMAHGGIVDKYIGDEIMAVFGAHDPQADLNDWETIRQTALNAIAAGLAMRQRLHQLNQEFAEEGSPTVEFGIGVHTGLVTAGSIGGSQRLNYSVIGDTVNVASRLESVNKLVYHDNPHKLMVTDSTLAYVTDRYVSRDVGIVRLQGRQQEIVVHCILGERER